MIFQIKVIFDKNAEIYYMPKIFGHRKIVKKSECQKSGDLQEIMAFTYMYMYIIMYIKYNLVYPPNYI